MKKYLETIILLEANQCFALVAQSLDLALVEPGHHLALAERHLDLAARIPHLDRFQLRDHSLDLPKPCQLLLQLLISAPIVFLLQLFFHLTKHYS